ncbi:hypothetical protein OS493_040458, partial [Desmophyllum pertusum]
GIVILVFCAFAIIATFYTFAVICRFWNTPFVKASSREFSLVLLISIVLLLTLVVINLFEPTDIICKIIYPWRLHNLQFVPVMSVGENIAHFKCFPSSNSALLHDKFSYQQTAGSDRNNYAHSAATRLAAVA